MDKERECGCKGRRTCLWCENAYNLKPDFVLSNYLRQKSYVYCLECDESWPGWNVLSNQHTLHNGERLPFPGVFIMDNFLNEEEASTLLHGIDNEHWDVSQSGRRKQNYGPKCNFKRRKFSIGNFKGFPKFSLFVQHKLRAIPLLNDFFVIEQCSLEYDPFKGASIDPHIDDCWIWGERIVTVNVLGDSVLTMLPYKGNETKYNLDLVQPNLMGSKKKNVSVDDVLVRIPMPAKSLLVLYGDARYKWEHCVLREDVRERRVCIAYREFTTPYLEGGEYAEEGKEVLNLSKSSLGIL